KMESSTVALNSADLTGGGIAATPAGPNLDITSTIVAKNTAQGIPTSPDIFAGTVDGSTSLIGVADTGFVFGINAGNELGGIGTPPDPKLAPWANNGGPTLTHLPALTSPVHNVGANPANLANDQRGPGFRRVLQGLPDIGAVESLDVIPVHVAG